MRALTDRSREGPRIRVEWLFALLVSSAFGYFVATGFWLGAAAVLVLTAFVVLILVLPDAIGLGWLLGMPTLFVFVNNAMMGVPFLTADRGVFLAAFGLLVARGLTKTGGLPSPGGVEKAMAVFLGIVLLSWATTVPVKGGGVLWKDVAMLYDSFLMPFGAYLLARSIAWTPSGRRRFVWWLVLWAGGYLVVAGLLEHALGTTFFMSLRHPTVHLDRVTGPFSNALAYGMVLGIFIILALWLFLQTKSPWARLVLIGAVGAFALCILLSKGRAVWLAVPLALLFLFLRSRRIRPLLAGLAILAGLAGPPFVLLSADGESLSERLAAASPVYNRVALAATALNMAAERPVLGYGFGESTFDLYKGRYYGSWGEVPAQYAAEPGLPHNDLLNILVMTGAVGLVAFVALFWICWRMLARRAARDGTGPPDGAALALFLQAIFIVIAINAQFMDILAADYYVPVLFFFLMGMVASEHKLATGKAAEPGSASSQRESG